MLNTEELIEQAQMGSDSMRTEILIQSTLTYFMWQQWRNYDPNASGNSEEEHDQLLDAYLIEREKLRTMLRTFYEESEEIWEEIDTIQIMNCLDSVSLLMMESYKYMVHADSLSEADKLHIDENAKLCALEYGQGVHFFRALASRFSDTDYRIYDAACEPIREQGNEGKNYNPFLDQVIEKEGLSIYPNPSNDVITISYRGEEKINSIEVIDLQGKIVSTKSFPTNSTKLSLDGLADGMY